MRTALVFLAVLLSACAEGTYPSPTDGRLTTRINTSYEARDACLAKNASADDISNSDPAAIARAVALACTAETEKLSATISSGGTAPAILVSSASDAQIRIAPAPTDAAKRGEISSLFRRQFISTYAGRR